ncbi:hypothetical protein K1T71_007328 [Dendrolimus kikuchii]|uniref:Uncharacterized protein n=1 Tax=Dendrolimus kikuchii TaxID=765133 RepID=A0ACC1D059_9NEOP|nr:hypothetical protein K1T71_007328 [Dendrolimus kikuchii]
MQRAACTTLNITFTFKVTIIIRLLPSLQGQVGLVSRIDSGTSTECAGTSSEITAGAPADTHTRLIDDGQLLTELNAVKLK